MPRVSGGAELLQNYSANDDFSWKTKVDEIANCGRNVLDFPFIAVFFFCFKHISQCYFWLTCCLLTEEVVYFQIF